MEETSLAVAQTAVVEYFRKQFVAQRALAIYQNFLYSSWSSWKIFLHSFLNPHTIYKTARLKVFYWLLDVHSVALNFPYSKEKSTYTCCLCEVFSVTATVELPVRA
jgi:hypothetical protein